MDPPRLLASYWLFRGIDLDRMFADTVSPPLIFADSGAFSAHVAGTIIDVAEYADWLHRWRHRLTCYANLDVIGDAERTLANQRALEARGLRPVPVWHAGEPVELLRAYCIEYRYVAIGGLVFNRAWSDVMPHMVRWFLVAQEHGARLHGFGLSHWRPLSTLPWYSIDSSTGVSGSKYGQAVTFTPKRGMQQIEFWNRAVMGRWGAHYRRWGFDPEVFLDRARYRRIHAVVLSHFEWMTAEAWLRDKHGLQYLRPDGRPEAASEPGLLMYSAWTPHDCRDLCIASSLGRWDEDAFAHRLRRPA